jgi:PAT family beta-lactamase induction signal transducer AmpG
VRADTSVQVAGGERKKREANPHLWVSSTYFAEGFPYSVVHQLAEVLFKEAGASLQAIGLTSLFHLPWNLKFLWGPLLDAFATKRAWMVTVELLMAVLLVGLALVATSGQVLLFASLLFALLAVLSATHDIAIDGYYLEALDEDDQSRFVGYRASAYKVAMMLVAGPTLIFVSKVGWSAAFAATAVVMLLLMAWHQVFLPRVEVQQRPARVMLATLLRGRVLAGAVVLAALLLAGRWLLPQLQPLLPAGLQTVSVSGWIAISLLASLLLAMAMLPRLKRALAGSDSFYAAAFVDFLAQDRVGRLLAFVVLFRAGESFLLKMRYPFLRDLGMSMEQYAFASGTVGLVASFVATLLGGYLISRHGLRRWIWPFVLAQNTLNLLYMWLASGSGEGLPAWTLVVTLEAFGSGLGTAVFMVYLMRCCGREHRAAHMALLTALMSLGFTIAGVASGFLAEALGFTSYFGFTFLASLPAMALIPLLPNLDRPTGGGRA